MSRAHDSQHSQDQQSATTDHDAIDAEHDPERARNTSLAGLNREADKIDKTDDVVSESPTPDRDLLGDLGTDSAGPDTTAHDKQHDAAGHATFLGLQSAMELTAKQMNLTVDEFRAVEEGKSTKRKEDPKDSKKPQDRIAKIRSRIGESLKRLAQTVTWGKPTSVTLLRKELGQVGHAYFVQFTNALDEATDHFGIAKFDNSEFDRHLEAMKLAISPNESKVPSDQPAPDKKESDLASESIEACVNAAHANATALRSGMAIATDDKLVLEADRVFVAARELDVMLADSANTSASIPRAKVKALVKELKALDTESKIRSLSSKLDPVRRLIPKLEQY